MNIMKNKLTKKERAVMAKIGSIGGKNGNGLSKVRGDSNYYKKIRSMRKDKAIAIT